MGLIPGGCPITSFVVFFSFQLASLLMLIDEMIEADPWCSGICTARAWLLCEWEIKRRVICYAVHLYQYSHIY